MDEATKWLIGQGVLGVVLVIMGTVFAAYWRHTEKRFKELSVDRGVLQEKRVEERETVVRALVTNTIALKEIADSTEQNNKALDVNSRALVELRSSNDSIVRMLENLARQIEHVRGPRR